MPKDHRKIWQWAESEIDFSRVPSYDCARKRKFDINYLPFWKQPLDDALDNNCKEIVILKCTRAGGSMTLLETIIRHSVAVRPQSILYVTGSRESVEQFFRLRLCKGMKLSPTTEFKYKAAQVYDTTILFPDMILSAMSPGEKMFGKQSAWSMICADEVSAYFDPAAIQALRTRQATVPFPKLVLISSPDANQSRNANEDPIFIEHAKADMREWMCLDPVAKKRFVLKMGDRKGNAPGLKIPQDAKNPDGSWNLNKVRKGVYYLTEYGTKIYEANRMDVVRSGIWVPTRKDMQNVEPGRRSYHVNCFMLPWFDLGEIATKWIEAVETSKAEVRSFILNYLAEPYYESKIQLRGNEVIYERSTNYDKGEKELLKIDEYKNKYEKLIKDYKEKNKDKEKVIPNPVLIVTGDVQKNYLYILARLWFSNGDSYLIDWDTVPTFTDWVEWIDKYKPYYAAVDTNYQDRRTEALDNCFKSRIISMVGATKSMKKKIDITTPDPYEGTKWAGKKKITQMMYDASHFKDILFELLNNQRTNKWYVYNNIENDYVRMLNSEKKLNGKWIEIHKENHILDMEVQQTAIAFHLGFLNPNLGVI